MIGQVLSDRYEIQQQLAKKAGRRTLLARDLETQELVVVKLLSFGSDFEWSDLKLFEREAETLKTLSHPAIPRYLDFFELEATNSKGFALVQTYIPAKSLAEHLKAGRTFSEQEVKQLALALLEILTYLHKRQPPVIHRDIKPSNILLAVDDNSIGQVYLVDFGSVQNLATRESGTMTVVGTYGYMPPEQFGDRTVPASDLYSLGATLIYLVTGTHPADLPQTDFRIQFEQAANISPAFANWLKWMTQPSLDRRLNSANTALQSLKQKQNRDSVSLELNRGTWDSNNWITKKQHTALLNVNKPAGSKVLLKKDIDSFEILIPPKGFNLGILGLSLFAIAWNSFIFFFTVSVLTSPFFPGNLFFALFSLPFWGAGISMITIILFSLVGKVRLSLNQRQIFSTYEMFGFEYNRSRPAKTQDINKLEYTQKAFTKDSDGNRVEVKPRIIIWAGTHKYELGGDDLLTEPELEWLAYELSDWLGLPITLE